MNLYLDKKTDKNVCSTGRKNGSSIKDFEDDSGCDFGDDRDCGFSVKLRMTKEDMKKEEKNGSSIKDFEDDSGCDFGDDISLVIQSDCGNPGSISFFNISKKNNIDS